MALPILGTLFVCYFLWHAVNGDNGILAWLQIHRNIETAKNVLTETTTRRATMEKRVSLLKSSGIDPDMLDERARIMTGLVHPQDYILSIGEAGDPGVAQPPKE